MGLVDRGGRSIGRHRPGLRNSTVAEIGLRYRFAPRKRKRGCARGVLILRAHVSHKRTIGGPRRSSRNIVEALLLRPAEVINDGLPEMIAVGERLTGSLRDPRVGGFQP